MDYIENPNELADKDQINLYQMNNNSMANNCEVDPRTQFLNLMNQVN